MADPNTWNGRLPGYFPQSHPVRKRAGRSGSSTRKNSNLVSVLRLGSKRRPPQSFAPRDHAVAKAPRLVHGRISKQILPDLREIHSSDDANGNVTALTSAGAYVCPYPGGSENDLQSARPRAQCLCEFHAAAALQPFSQPPRRPGGPHPVAAAYGGSSTLKLVTKSGKELAVDQ